MKKYIEIIDINFIIYQKFKMNYPPAQVPEEDPPLSLHSAFVIQVPFLYVWLDDLQKLKKFT